MNSFKLLTFVFIFVLGIAALSCGGKFDQGQPKKYDITGLVTAISKADHRVTVHHGAVPGYMDEAMDMPYPLKDDSGYDKLAVGDTIKAKLVVMPDSRTWLEDVVVTQKQDLPSDKK